MSQSALAAISPMSQAMISSIANSTYPAKIGKVKCKEFGEWYLKFREQGSQLQSQLQVPSASSSSSRRKMVTTDTRFTFHPSNELPLLREWFRSCRNPSDETLQTYADQLNANPFRLSRLKVTQIKLKNWFKNERQRERKHKLCEDSPMESPSKRRSRSSTKSLDEAENEVGIGAEKSDTSSCDHESSLLTTEPETT